MLVSPHDDPMIREEVRYAISEVYNWFRARGLIIGNPPWTDRLAGKISQLGIAAAHFRIPSTLVAWGDGSLERLSQGRWVAKSLSSQTSADGAALFTTEVNTRELSQRFPWYLQELLEASYDVTVQVVGTTLWAFALSREGLKTPDWRYETFTRFNTWERYELSDPQKAAIWAVLRELGLSWGRIDFLLCDNELVFLELNPNGQWAFLDPENSAGLIDAVVEYMVHFPTSEGPAPLLSEGTRAIKS